MNKLSLEKINELLNIKNTDIDIKNEKYSKLLPFLDSHLCNILFTKQLKISYLSHWKSTVESLILKKRQAEHKKIFEKFSTSNKVSPEIIEIMKSSQPQIMNSLYSIVILERKISQYKMSGLIVTDKGRCLDTIIIHQDMTLEEKRCVVAHELGHIIINRLLNENDKYQVQLDKEQQESVANLLMYYILNDKSNFYQQHTNDFIYKNIQEIETLMNQIIENIGTINSISPNSESDS